MARKIDKNIKISLKDIIDHFKERGKYNNAFLREVKYHYGTIEKLAKSMGYNKAQLYNLIGDKKELIKKIEKEFKKDGYLNE